MASMKPLAAQLHKSNHFLLPVVSQAASPLRGAPRNAANVRPKKRQRSAYENNARAASDSIEIADLTDSAEHDNGRLLLNKIFVQDHETEIYAQPELKGHIPKIAQRYAEVNWVEEFVGDTLNNEEGWKKVSKVYLVKISAQEPFRLDLNEVYSIDSTDRVLQREDVLWLTEERDPQLITLRIRPEGLYVEANEEMISDFELVEMHLIEQEEARVAELEEKSNLGTTVMAEEAPRDPIDALNDDEREYDETMEDTPSVDQGF